MIDEKFWLAIAFTTFALIIIKFVWPKMVKALDTKSRQIAEEILQAKELKEKAILLLQDAEKCQKEAEAKAKQLLIDAENEAKKFATEAKEALENEVKRRSQAAIERIKIEEEMAIREIKSDIINSAFKKIGQDLGNNISADQQNRLMEKALERI